MAPRKSHPNGIDFAAPNKNFVKTSFENKGIEQDYWEYMYPIGGISPGKKASGYGYNATQRVGKLRMSGNPKAHRIGKR